MAGMGMNGALALALGLASGLAGCGQVHYGHPAGLPGLAEGAASELGCRRDLALVFDAPAEGFTHAGAAQDWDSQKIYYHKGAGQYVCFVDLRGVPFGVKRLK